MHTGKMQNILDLIDWELHRLIQIHRHQQAKATTPWHTLSLTTGPDSAATTTTDVAKEIWETSETPYDEWISDPNVDKEVSLLLNMRHLEDGQDWFFVESMFQP